jgi:hypothetical protein
MARVGNARSHTAAFWPIVFLDFAAWIVLLAGVASLQRYNYVRSGDYANDSTYSWQWWATIFQLIALIGVFYTTSWGHHDVGRVAVVAFLAISTVVLFTETNTYYGLHRSGAAPHPRIITYFVGALLSSLFNLLLIIFLGTTAFEVTPVVGNRGTGIRGNKAGAPATTGTTGAAAV